MIIGAGSIVTASGALLGVLGLIALASWLVRSVGPRLILGGRLSRPQAEKQLTLRETVALDPRRRLHLVQCGERQVVLLTGGSQDIVVGWVGGS